MKLWWCEKGGREGWREGEVPELMKLSQAYGKCKNGW